jgi:hypothetical protein
MKIRHAMPPAAGLSCLILLSACQMTQAPQPQSSAPQDRAVISPAPPPQELDVSRETKTTRTVGSDGNLRQTTQSTRVSVDAGHLIASLAGAGTPATDRAPKRSDFHGAWTLRQPEGQTCRMTLRAGSGRGIVGKSGCFHDSVFFVSGWDLRGRELVLTNAVGDELATLRPTGPDRLEGNGLILYR